MAIWGRLEEVSDILFEEFEEIIVERIAPSIIKAIVWVQRTSQIKITRYSVLKHVPFTVQWKNERHKRRKIMPDGELGLSNILGLAMGREIDNLLQSQMRQAVVAAQMQNMGMNRQPYASANTSTATGWEMADAIARIEKLEAHIVELESYVKK